MLDSITRPPDTSRLLARLSRLIVKLVKTRTVRYRYAAPLASFTFDDILETAYTCGAPLLERYGARGTYYVTGGLLGTSTADRSFASAEQVLDLHRRGHEIGCHTFAHEAVATQSAQQLLGDADRNQAVFAAIAPDLRLESFAYPFNATNFRARQVLQHRFASCRAGVAGLNLGRVDLGYLRTVELCDDMIDLGGVRYWVAEAVRRKGWVIFLTHGVTEDQQAWRTTPVLLEGALAALKEKGVAIATVRDAVRRIQSPSTKIEARQA